MKDPRISIASIVVTAGLILTGCSSTSSEDSPPSAGETSSARTSTSSAPLHAIGEEATNAGVKLVVESVEEAESISLYAKGYKRGFRPDEVVSPRQGGKFVIVTTTVENTGSETWDLTCGGAIRTKLVSREDNQYDPIRDLYRIHDNPECNDSVGAGFPTKMTWIYEIPTTKQARAFGFLESGNYNGTFTLVDFDLPHKTPEKPTTSVAPSSAPAEGSSLPDPAIENSELGNAPAPAQPIAEAPAAAPATAPQQQAPPADAVTGFTGAPNGAPTAINKTISYCMNGPEYQPGTTMFTDGTTGWTTQCYGQ